MGLQAARSVAAPTSGSSMSSAMDTLAVHHPTSHLVLYMRLNKGVNPGTQLAPSVTNQQGSVCLMGDMHLYDNQTEV